MGSNNQVLLYKDGNEICALLGDNIMEGTAGFGKTVSAALIDLAAALIEEGVEDEIESSLESR